MKKLVSKLHISDIIPPSRFLLPEELVGSTFSSLLFSIFFSSSFHFHQFFSNFLKYSSSNFLLSHPYSSFAVYFPGNSALLKSFSSAQSNFSCLLTSTFILPSKFTTSSFAFFKFSSFSQLSFSAVNSFHCTKYFVTPLTFLLFKIFSTFHFSTSFTSTGFPSSFFYPFTWSLYHTTQLTFTTR